MSAKGASDWALAHADGLRLALLLVTLAAMLVWELAAPWRRAEIPHLIRWSNNLALVILDGLVVRLVFPVLAVGVAMRAESRGFGLFPLLGLTGPVGGVAGFVLLDLAIWAQHRIFHAVPMLWRLHRMHHADPDIDATTGLRFHPVEIVLSMAIKIALTGLFGLPALAVLTFEAALNATSIFNHANIRLPRAMDRVLRLVIVTPDMHRVHHSVIRAETDSNFGFNLALWDRLFGTYRAVPEGGLERMTTGQRRFRTPRDQWLDRLLLQPLRGPAADPSDDRAGSREEGRGG